VEKLGTGLGTVRAGNVGKDGYPHGIRKRMQNGFHRNVFNRRMEEGPHVFDLTFTKGLVQ
jgi:hypothetical protein